MIVFDLSCGEGHRFEGWFASSGDFAKQKKRGLLSCPASGPRSVEKDLSAPRFNGRAPAPQPAKVPASAPLPQKTPDMEGKDPFAVAQMLYSRMLDEVLSKSEDVGKEFAAEARRIFYSQAPGRAIRGQATDKEHDALLEEGIPVARLAVPPPHRLN